MALKDLKVKISSDTTGFQKGLKSMLSGLKSVASTAAKLAGVTAGINGAVKAMQSFVALESSVKRVSGLFNESAKYIEYFATTTAKSLGMSESAAYSYAATYGNLFKNITADTSENAKVTIAMLKASSVVVSKTGRTMEDVMERIRSGLLGNTEAIEDLGINVNVAMLEVTDAFKQIADGRSWEQLTFYEQQQIRTLAILEQASSNFGDEIQQGSAFSISVLTGSIKDLIAVSGSFINVALKPMIAGLTTVVQTATGAMKALASLMGLNLTSDTGSLASGFSSSADSSTEISDNMSDTVDSAKALKKQLAGFDELNVLSKATDTGSGEDTASSANSGGTSVFDSLPALEYEKIDIDTSWLEEKLDKLSQKLAPLKSSFSGLWDSLSPLQGFAAAGLENFYNSFLAPVGGWVLGEGLPRFVDILSEGISNIDWDTINGGFDTLWQALAPFAVNIGEGLLWLWDNILVNFGTWVMNDLLPAGLGLLSSAIEALDSVVNAFKPMGKWLWEKFLEPIAKWTGGAIVSIIEGLAEALKKLSDWIAEHQTAVENMVIIFVSLAGALKIAGLITTIVTAFGAFAAKIAAAGGLLAILKGALAALLSPIGLIALAIGAIIAIGVLLVKHWDEIKAFAVGMWERIMEAMYGFYDNCVEVFNNVADFLSDIWESIKLVWSVVSDYFKSKFEEAVTNIKNAFSAIGTWFSNRWNDIKVALAGVGSWFKNKFTEACDNVKGVFSAIGTWFSDRWTDIKSVFNNIGDWFSEKFQAAYDGIVDIFGGLGDWFSGVWESISTGAKNGINLVIDKVNGLVTAVETAINFLIDAINSISIDIPDWIPEEVGGGKTLGFNFSHVNIGEIPRLASGGIIEKPTIAMVGEAGKEAVVPLENNTGWLDKLADRISASVSSGTVGGDIHAHVELDGREVGYFCIRAVELNKARMGG